MINESEKLSVLADHYKDTCEIVRSREKVRERRLLFVISMLAVVLIQIHNEQNLTQISEDIATKFISKPTFQSTFYILQYAILIFLSIFVQLYYQVDCLIERSYNYIHDLEDTINNVSGSDIIFREGKSYLSGYPKFSRWTWFFYKWLVPLIILIVPITEVTMTISELGISYTSSFKIFMVVLIGVSTILYLRLVHWKK